MIRRLSFVLIFVAVFSFPTFGFPQEEGAVIAKEEGTPADTDVEYGYGTVVEVKKGSNELVLSEYDWELDEENEITYSIDPKVTVENVDSWKNIPKDTYIDVEYTTDKSGRRVISYISIYETEELESDME